MVTRGKGIRVDHPNQYSFPSGLGGTSKAISDIADSVLQATDDDGQHCRVDIVPWILNPDLA